MRTYTTATEYIEHYIAPGLGDVEITNEQALEIAQRMTYCNKEGQIIEREDMDFWDVVADVLGDN